MKQKTTHQNQSTDSEKGEEEKRQRERKDQTRKQVEKREEGASLTRNYKERIHGYPDGPGGGYNGL